MSIKVEFGFNKNSLGNYLYQDITSYTMSMSISRGKQNNIGSYSAGQASIGLNNRLRTFDPNYSGSPFAGLIRPGGSLRLSRDGIQIFEGVIEDWNLSYTLDGESIATITASDAFSLFNNQTYGVDTDYNAELSSVRLGNVLNVGSWPSSKRRISLGVATLEADTLKEGDGVLDYLQKIELSEAGRMFVDANGYLVFKTRNDNAYGSSYSYTRKNLCKNPSFEVDTTYWSAGTRVTHQYYVGAASLSLSSSTYINYTQDTSTPYTLSFWVYCETGTPTITVSGLESADGTTYTTTESASVAIDTYTWTRVSVSYLSDFSKTYGRMQISTTAGVFVDAVLIEATSNLQDYFDGTYKPTDDAINTYTSSWDGV